MTTAVPWPASRSVVARIPADCPAKLPSMKPRTFTADVPGFEISTSSCPSAENSLTTTLPTWSDGTAGAQPPGRQTWRAPQFTSSSAVVQPVTGAPPGPWHHAAGQAAGLPQRLWSGCSLQPVVVLQCGTVQVKPSASHKLSTGSWWTPVTESQLSVVQAIPSLTFTGVWLTAPLPGSQASTVHAFESSVGTGSWCTPVTGSQL